VKIARIPYLNAEPFYAGWGDDPPFDVVELVPRALGAAARDGVIDAGLMAVADWFTVSGDFALIEPALGVAARQEVRSVILFTDEPVRLLAGRRIGVTGESSTSRRLLELLARAKWSIEDVTWVPEEEIAGAPRGDVDAMLLIGNRALEVMALPDRGGWTRAVDLASEWWAWQGLPFVFAVWAVRTAVPRRERERFAGFLSGSLALGSERLGEIADARAGRLGEADALRDYLENLVYRLGPAELDGLQRFRDLLAEHDILEYPTAPV
jgi:chorismate dehydratase